MKKVLENVSYIVLSALVLSLAYLVVLWILFWKFLKILLKQLRYIFLPVVLLFLAYLVFWVILSFGYEWGYINTQKKLAVVEKFVLAGIGYTTMAVLTFIVYKINSRFNSEASEKEKRKYDKYFSVLGSVVALLGVIFSDSNFSYELTMAGLVLTVVPTLEMIFQKRNEKKG